METSAAYSGISGSGRLFSDASIAGVFFRAFDLPPSAVPGTLKVDVPDRTLTAAFQVDVASVATALYLALSGPADHPAHLAHVQATTGFAIGVTHRCRAYARLLPLLGLPRGAGLLHTRPWARLFLRPAAENTCSPGTARQCPWMPAS